MATIPSEPIAKFQSLLKKRANIDLSHIELAEILWLALQENQEISLSQNFTKLPKKPDQLPSPSIKPPENTRPEEQPQDTAALVTEPPKTTTTDKPWATKSTVLPVNLPEVVALRNRREISRSLRPLMRKVASNFRQTIDEEATIVQIAETQTWSPVMVSEKERWLELAIVIEVTNLLEVWRETIAELCQVMARQGAFRDVRTWQLRTNKQDELELFLQTTSGLKSRPRRPKELQDAGGRRLILLLSDATSQSWRAGKIFSLLDLWSETNPLTLVQLLPEHYWNRTAFKRGYPVMLKSRQPGALSRDWKIDGLSQKLAQKLVSAHKFPVITVQPEEIGEWAKAIAALGEQQTRGLAIVPEAFPSQSATQSLERLTAQQIVRQFRGTASSQAQNLADRMAVLPVNWSVIRLVQKNWQTETSNPRSQLQALPLAEIFLSGLIRRLQPTQEQSTLDVSLHSEKGHYDFVEGVRDILLGTIPISEAHEVGEQIARQFFKQLPRSVQERVAEDIEQRFGTSIGFLGHFQAFLIVNLPWGETIQSEVLPFAQVTKEVFRRWGSEYEAFAEQLARVPVIPKGMDLSGFPPLRTAEFDVLNIEISELSAGIQLQRSAFNVVTIAPKQPRDYSLPAETIDAIERQQQLLSRSVSRYQNFEALQANEQEDETYRIVTQAGTEMSDVAIVVPHGGNIEPGALEIGRAIAGDDHSFYALEGLDDGNNHRLSIPSQRFDEPRGLEIAGKAKHLIAIHGFFGDEEKVYVEGLDSEMRSKLAESLREEHFEVLEYENSQFAGHHPGNICNRSSTGKGIQIGIEWGLRQKLLESLRNPFRIEPSRFERFVQAVRNALSPLEAAGLQYQTTQGEAEYFVEELGDNIALEMVLIPEGTFMMGAPADEEGSDGSERQQHEVLVPGFFMGRYPITQGQWRIVAGWEPVEKRVSPDPSTFKDSYENYDRWNRPIERVSWEDAQEFCARLSRKTKKTYRLPSEAEWEYACRAGTSTPFHFGETITTDLANYQGTDGESYGWKGSYGMGPKGEYQEQTTPVDYFQVANSFGLYDMHGNVWEWCEDDWHSNYDDAPEDESAWLEANSSQKVRRGGSWFNSPRDCRSAYRYYRSRVYRINSLGFRVCCELPRTNS